MNRTLGIPVTSWKVIINTCSLDESIKLKISIHYKTVATDFWRKACWFSVQAFMFATILSKIN